MTFDEAIRFLRLICSEVSDMRVEEYFNGKEVMFAFVGLDGNPRTAAVRTPASRWYSVEVEELYDHTFVDEDATDSEIREYLRQCVAVAEAYVRDGGTEERKGRWGPRSLVVEVEGVPVRLTKLIGRRGNLTHRRET